MIDGIFRPHTALGTILLIEHVCGIPLQYDGPGLVTATSSSLYTARPYQMCGQVGHVASSTTNATYI